MRSSKRHTVFVSGTRPEAAAKRFTTPIGKPSIRASQTFWTSLANSASFFSLVAVKFAAKVGGDAAVPTASIPVKEELDEPGADPEERP